MGNLLGLKLSFRWVRRRWPHGQDWIRFPARAGSFSEDTMLQPLLELLAEKIAHYGISGTGFDHLSLVVYYNAAWIYNSPVETPHHGFETAAAAAAEFLGDDLGPFHSIQLFVAIDDGRVIPVVPPTRSELRTTAIKDL